MIPNMQKEGINAQNLVKPGNLKNALELLPELVQNVVSSTSEENPAQPKPNLSPVGEIQPG